MTKKKAKPKSKKRWSRAKLYDRALSLHEIAELYEQAR